MVLDVQMSFKLALPASCQVPQFFFFFLFGDNKVFKVRCVCVCMCDSSHISAALQFYGNAQWIFLGPSV